MYKVYLVEDESIVREGLRDNIPWEQYGFAFIGDSADGELALPEILRLQPDVLITDIRMPFMDGLSLSRIVKKKLPQTRIIILSGYHDFDYAQKAIEIGVERFLTKPVTRRAVTQLLAELAQKIETEQRSRDDLRRRQEEIQEYEQFRRRRFLESLFAGRMSVEEIYQESTKLRLDLSGPCYSIILFDVFDSNARDLTQSVQPEGELLRIRWIGTSFCVIVKGAPDIVTSGIAQAEEEISRITAASDGNTEYFLCVSPVSDRLSGLKDCYEKVGRYYTCRYTHPDRHVITQEVYEEITGDLETDEKTDAEDSTAAGVNAGPGVNSGDVLQRTLKYIDDHYTEDVLSLQTAAKEADVSPGYLSGMFSQKMGMTFIEYVTSRRIDKAKQLLTDTHEHTAVIAAMVGYKDPNYFRYVFKKTTGVTPREYRSR